VNSQDLLHDFFSINSNGRDLVLSHAPAQRALPHCSMHSENPRQAACEMARSISSTSGHALSGSICLRCSSLRLADRRRPKGPQGARASSPSDLQRLSYVCATKQRPTEMPSRLDYFYQEALASARNATDFTNEMSIAGRGTT
jgi:hypothetical protein